MLELRIAIAAVAAGLTAAGLTLTWHRWRKEELRRTEVLEWSLATIAVLQELFLVSVLAADEISDKEKFDRIRDAKFKTSVLTEQGRLFFKNEPFNNWGSEKPAAYRGLRPRILDHIVTAHMIARAWPDGDASTNRKRSVVLEQCAREFLTLAQEEVGRSRAASARALKGGQNVSLQKLFSEVDPQKDFLRPQL